LGTIGLVALLVIGAAGLGGAYALGLFGAKPVPAANVAASTPAPTSNFKPEMVKIPGGTFKMGRNNGPEMERGEHEVVVKPFSIEKTEVTNGEYYQFVSQTGYQNVPSHWINGKPIAGQEKMPVRLVNIADVNAFIAWRLNRDGIAYRLPTEEEWEYAARNGAKDNLYPWGDTFRAECAVVDKGEIMQPAAVGTASCPNEWGVMDLIGNVYEWTG